MKVYLLDENFDYEEYYKILDQYSKMQEELYQHILDTQEE